MDTVIEARQQSTSGPNDYSTGPHGHLSPSQAVVLCRLAGCGSVENAGSSAQEFPMSDARWAAAGPIEAFTEEGVHSVSLRDVMGRPIAVVRRKGALFAVVDLLGHCVAVELRQGALLSL